MTSSVQIVLDQEMLGGEADADVTEWVVSDGASVDEGQVIMLLESSKVVIEITAPVTGQVQFSAAVGSVVFGDTTLATIEVP